MAMQATDHAWGKDSERRPLKSLQRLAFPLFHLLLLLRPLTSFSMSSILLLRTAVRRTDKDRRPRAITAPNGASIRPCRPFAATGGVPLMTDKAIVKTGHDAHQQSGRHDGPPVADSPQLSARPQS